MINVIVFGKRFSTDLTMVKKVLNFQVNVILNMDYIEIRKMNLKKN